MSVYGLIGHKVGTTQVFHEDGSSDCVTAIQAGPCTVTQIKTVEKDGYEAAQLGFDSIRRQSKPLAGHARASGKMFRHLREVPVENMAEVEVGQEIDVGLFKAGELVNATGLSKGRGFAGGVRRYNFRGGPKTHGQSDRHRAPGSIGAGTYPGRVLKGHRMAGHMGNARRTVRKLEVVLADPDRNLLLLKGSVPGARNSLLLIRKTGLGVQ